MGAVTYCTADGCCGDRYERKKESEDKVGKVSLEIDSFIVKGIS